MDISKLASVVLERRQQMSHIVMPGDIASKAGSEGLAESIRRQWLVPDHETGYLVITGRPDLISEMKKLAADHKTSSTPAATEWPMAFREMFPKQPAERCGIVEIAPPATGKPPAGPMPTPPGPAITNKPPQPSPVGGKTDGAYNVGDDVIVTQEGQSFQGKIEAREADGSFKVSFSGQRPPVQKNYRQEEMKRLQAQQ